jgi:methionyl-tRNA synthetase
MKRFFITTAIDYVNGSPHLGHAYEKVLTDVIARQRRLMGDQVHFLTGTDEHGQKVQQTAQKMGIEPKRYVDEMSAAFQALLPRLGISNDIFVRTTDAGHANVVRSILQQLHDQGDIYLGEYRGPYSVRQEQFLREKDRNPDGSWPEIYGEVIAIAEPSYFFRLKVHQEWLIDFLAKNENFIFPRHRQKQVLEFLKDPLNDLCISRPRERLEWGIPLPFDEKHVTYVWFDALLSYYSGVLKFPGVWPATWHVIGKDILVPAHAIYWPIMLHAAGLPLPRGILVHGWWTQSGAKMSKSTGNTLDPLDLVGEFGVDAFRYFLIREMNVGQDSDFTREQFLVRYNGDLANDLGNLVNRTLNMINRFASGAVPAFGESEEAERDVRALWETTRGEFLSLGDGFQFHTALERVFAFVKSINGYIEKRAPWKLGKSSDPRDLERLRTALATMAESLRLAAAALRPVMPGAAEKINEVLGIGAARPDAASPWLDELAWGERLTGAKVALSLVLFPRPERAEGPGKK